MPADTEFIGWDYGDAPVPLPAEGKIYVLDLSPECVTGMVACGNLVFPEAQRLIWIDHHKSAIEKFRRDVPGYRIDGVAACRLAWQWLIRHSNGQNDDVMPPKQFYIERRLSEPRAVRLAGEYDIWDKRDPDAELFQHGLRTRDLDDSKWGDSPYWSVLLSESMEAKAMVNDLLASGKYLQYARTRENASIIAAAGFTVEWEGLRFLACNAARFNSHLFTAGLKPEHDACLGFAFNGLHWKVSLYHAPGKEHHDLSLIAGKYKGGGHKGACGFVADKLPFVN